MVYPIDWRIADNGALVIERGAEASADDRPRDLGEALEAMTANDSYEWLTPEEVGALTDAPILGYDVSRTDTGYIIDTGIVYWYPQYETRDPLAELVDGGRLIFTRATDYADERINR